MKLSYFYIILLFSALENWNQFQNCMEVVTT